MRPLFLGFGYQIQAAVLPFQKLLAFGLYLNRLGFLFYVLSLSYLEKHNVYIEKTSVMVVVVYIEKTSVMVVVVYLGFSVIHGCR